MNKRTNPNRPKTQAQPNWTQADIQARQTDKPRRTNRTTCPTNPTQADLDRPRQADGPATSRQTTVEQTGLVLDSGQAGQHFFHRLLSDKFFSFKTTRFVLKKPQPDGQTDGQQQFKQKFQTDGA